VTKASVCSLVLPLSPLFLRSQISDNISLVGTVADKTGSVASGAKVTAGEQSTRVRDSAVTGTAGHYAITFIQSGTYDITVEQAGFSKVRTTGVAVRTDLTLAAGSTAGTVTVSAGTPSISTDAASLGETFTPKQVEGLPSKVITRSRLRLWHPTSPLGKGDVPIPRAEAFKVTNRPSAANPNGGTPTVNAASQSGTASDTSSTNIFGMATAVQTIARGTERGSFASTVRKVCRLIRTVLDLEPPVPCSGGSPSLPQFFHSHSSGNMFSVSMRSY
jgi:hypothetical protein